MEIIEKQVEKVKEVPADGYYGYGYGRRDINGKANAGLTLGIIGTALGAWALFGNRRSSGLLGLAGSGMGGMNEHEFMDKFKNFMTKYRRNSMRHGNEGDFMPMDDFYMRRHGRPDEFMDMFDSRGDRFSDRFNESGMGGNDMDKMMRYMRNSMNGEHFTESEAKYLVADMYHTENGRKYSGEKFDMHKAKEICERYRGILPTSVTPADVYVAINSQYHDYAELFKNWFGDGIEQKIVESAIVFWFKDADCKAENKVVEYLREY